MAKERNSLKAGLFIIASIALTIAIIVGIKGVGRFLEPMQQAYVTFKLTDDIGGLSPGDEVRVGGAKVGTVRNVDFVENPGGGHSITIRFSLPRRFLVRKDAVVSIQSTVTGVSVLNFSNLGSGEPLAAGQSLIGHPSSLSALLETAPDLSALVRDVRTVTMPKINNAIDHATDTVASFQTGADAAREFIVHLRSQIDPIISRYNAVAETAKTALQQIADMFGDSKVDFRTTIANLRDATGTVRDKLPGVMDKMDGLLSKVTLAVEDTSQALQDVKKIAANTRDVSTTARQVMVGNRGRIDSMIASLKTTGDNLKQASSEIRRSPWRLLYKPGAGEMANLNLYDSTRQFAEGAGQLNDAAIALRDALKDPDVEQAQVQKLVERLDQSFTSFSDVEQQLWKQVKE